MKIFYDHLTPKDELLAPIYSSSLDPEEVKELENLIDEIIHHKILNLILNHLPDEHHEAFVGLISKDPSSSQIIVFINERISFDIEVEISNHFKSIKSEIEKDIHKSRKK